MCRYGRVRGDDLGCGSAFELIRVVGAMPVSPDDLK